MITTHDETSAALQRKLGVSTANLSQHLAVLKSAGVIVTRREGKTVHCSLAIPEVKQACHLIRNAPPGTAPQRPAAGHIVRNVIWVTERAGKRE